VISSTDCAARSAGVCMCTHLALLQGIRRIYRPTVYLGSDCSRVCSWDVGDLDAGAGNSLHNQCDGEMGTCEALLCMSTVSMHFC
jgi:hypothetical protein